MFSTLLKFNFYFKNYIYRKYLKGIRGYIVKGKLFYSFVGLLVFFFRRSYSFRKFEFLVNIEKLGFILKLRFLVFV